MVNPFKERLEQRNNIASNPFEKRLLQKKPEPMQEEFSSPEQDQKELERNEAQLTSRFLETILGAPGDIASFATGLVGKEQHILPTSKQLRGLSEKATLGYTKPKNEFEESAGELLSDIGSMAFPGTGAYSFARNIGIPVIGNLVKEGIKYGSTSEKSQAYGKVGTMVALDLLTRNKGGVKSHIGSLYEKAEKAIPKGISGDAKGLERSLKQLEKQLTAGGSRPTTKKSLEKITEIQKEIKNGKIDIKRLAAYRPSINEAIQELGGFTMDIPRKLKPQAVKNLNSVKKEVIKTLDQYGEKFNPEYLKYNRAANEAYAAMEKSNVVANFLHKHVPYAPESKAVQALFSYAPTAGAAALLKVSPISSAGALAGLGAYSGFKILHRVMNSPELRKYYLNTLKAASIANGPEAAKNLKALDQALLNDHQKEDTESMQK